MAAASPPSQRVEPRVGAQRVDARIDLEPDHDYVAVLGQLAEGGQRLVVLA
jgi:hypothetical protein